MSVDRAQHDQAGVGAPASRSARIRRPMPSGSAPGGTSPAATAASLAVVPAGTWSARAPSSAVGPDPGSHPTSSASRGPRPGRCATGAGVRGHRSSVARVSDRSRPRRPCCGGARRGGDDRDGRTGRVDRRAAVDQQAVVRVGPARRPEDGDLRAGRHVGRGPATGPHHHGTVGRGRGDRHHPGPVRPLAHQVGRRPSRPHGRGQVVQRHLDAHRGPPVRGSSTCTPPSSRRRRGGCRTPIGRRTGHTRGNDRRGGHRGPREAGRHRTRRLAPLPRDA